MDGNLEISLDKLPVRRLESIEEHGAERFLPDAGYDGKRESLIRRVDFAWAVEREDEEAKKKKQKQKKSAKESASSTPPWPYQSMVENLQLAHQELSVVIDVINTVEANDAITVAGMTRPKPLPKEALADLAVSTATKLQCYRVTLANILSSLLKALEQQIARETRFYGALIRLQQNWKVKRQRVAAVAPGKESFTFDLFDSSLYDSAATLRPSFLSTIRIDHDSAGMLAINLPPKSCRSLHFGFFGKYSDECKEKSTKIKRHSSAEDSPKEIERDSISDNECVKETHLLLRRVHQAIFDEQVFYMVNRGILNQCLGVNVTGMHENYLQLSIGAETSVFISLLPSSEYDQSVDGGDRRFLESAVLPLDSLEGLQIPEENLDSDAKKSNIPNYLSYEIYLKQMFHEYAFGRGKNKPLSTGTHVSVQPAKDGSNLLQHFSTSLAHRIFSNKVLKELENVVCKVTYLHLISYPTWHSRTSSWTVFMKVPGSVLHESSQAPKSNTQKRKDAIKSEFRTKIIVNDDCISIEAEGAPNVVDLFNGNSEDKCSTNKYDCDLADLPVIILQQVASQVIRWLHQEALAVGVKLNRDFLSLCFELEQGEILSLMAQVDPKDTQGCISWWLVMEDGYVEERKPHLEKKFLRYLPLDVLYSTLMDLVGLCIGSGNH